MAEGRVTDDFDELLSAYVDGELTADERALVEERLRIDTQAARMVAEMRTLAKTLQALPRESLGFDVAPAVQAAAERQKLAIAAHTLDHDGPPIADRGFKRGFVWATLAIAATLVLAFVAENQQPGDRADREVAKAEPERERDPSPPAGNARSIGSMTTPREAAESQLGETLSAAPPMAAESPRPNAAGEALLESSSDRSTAPEERGDPAGELALGAAPVLEGESMERFAGGRQRSAEPMDAPASAPADAPAQVAANQPESSKNALAASSAVGDRPDEPVSVELETTAPDALEQLAKLLMDEGIAVERDVDDAEVSAAGRDAQVEFQEAGDELRAREARSVADAVDAEDRARPTRKRAAITEVVLVEAPVQVIAQVLQKAEAQTQLFSAVRVDSESRAAEYGFRSEYSPPTPSGGGMQAMGRRDAGGFGGGRAGGQSIPATPPESGQKGAAPAPLSQVPAASSRAEGAPRQPDNRQPLARARILQWKDGAYPSPGLYFRQPPTAAQSSALASELPDADPSTRVFFYFTQPVDSAREATPAK